MVDAGEKPAGIFHDTAVAFVPGSKLTPKEISDVRQRICIAVSNCSNSADII